jgi:hypothetical protein
MRIESIDVDSGVSLAAQISYSELKGVNGKIAPDALADNSGVRFLQDNGWRSSDLYEITRALQLSGKENKILLLQLLKRSALLELIGLMDKGLIIDGLRFLSQEKLLRMMMLLPKMVLFQLLLQLMSLETLIKFMPPGELFNILRSRKLDNRAMLQGFQGMDPKFLLQLMGYILNTESHGLRHAEMLHVLFTTKKHIIMDGLKELPYKALQPFVTSFVKQNPELLELVSQAFVFKMLSQIPKPALLATLHCLPKEIIMDLFVSQLADKFLVMVASNIDEKTLSEYLISSQPQLLLSIAAGLAA